MMKDDMWYSVYFFVVVVFKKTASIVLKFHATPCGMHPPLGFNALTSHAFSCGNYYQSYYAPVYIKNYTLIGTRPKGTQYTSIVWWFKE